MATRAADLVSRAAAAVVGGYALSYAFTASLAAALRAAGLTRPDAVVTASMLSFIVYLAAIIYAFGARSAGRAWSWISTGLVVFGTVALFAGFSH